MGVSLADDTQDSCPTCAKEETQKQIRDDIEKKTNVSKHESSDLYSRDTALSYSSVFSQFSARVMSAPVASFAGTFFDASGLGGACPAWDVTAYFVSLRFDQFCGDVMAMTWPIIHGLVIFAASLMGFRWAVM